MDVWAQYIEPHVCTWGFLSCYFSSPLVQSWIRQCSSTPVMESGLVMHLVRPQLRAPVRDFVTLERLQVGVDIRPFLFMDLFLWSDLLRRARFLSIRNCQHVCFPSLSTQRRLSHIFLVDTHVETTIPVTRSLTLRRTQFTDLAVGIDSLCRASLRVDLDSFEYLAPLVRSTRRIHWQELRCVDRTVYQGPLSLIVGQYAPFASLRVLHLHFLQRENVLFDVSAFPNVSDLDLYGVEILSPHIVMSCLRKLTLRQCTNIGALQFAQRANEVSLSHCPYATNVIGLQQCHSLRIVSCPITHLYCLQSTHCLTHMTIIHCPLQFIWTFPSTSLTLHHCGLIQLSYSPFLQHLEMCGTTLQPVSLLEHVHHLHIVHPETLYSSLEWEWIKCHVHVTCVHNLEEHHL